MSSQVKRARFDSEITHSTNSDILERTATRFKDCLPGSQIKNKAPRKTRYRSIRYKPPLIFCTLRNKHREKIFVSAFGLGRIADC